MRNDILFLKSQNLMDYSMLIAIESCRKPKKELHTEQFDGKALNQGFILLGSEDGRGSTNYRKRLLGEWMSEKHRFQFDKKILHISIIDYLQEWNFSKKSERAYKTLILRKDPQRLSAIEPQEYARRFRYFMESNVFSS